MCLICCNILFVKKLADKKHVKDVQNGIIRIMSYRIRLQV